MTVKLNTKKYAAQIAGPLKPGLILLNSNRMAANNRNEKIKNKTKDEESAGVNVILSKQLAFAPKKASPIRHSSKLISADSNRFPAEKICKYCNKSFVALRVVVKTQKI